MIVKYPYGLAWVEWFKGMGLLSFYNSDHSGLAVSSTAPKLA